MPATKDKVSSDKTMAIIQPLPLTKIAARVAYPLGHRQKSRLTAAITAPHFTAFPIARLSSGHNDRNVRAQ
jgi:hypothetical protein